MLLKPTIRTAIGCGMLVTCLSAFAPKGADNSLTSKEKKEGWQLLFDGKDYKGWHNYQNKQNDSWEIVDGQLHCKSEGVTKRADLTTDEEYGDFELAVDWKIDPKSNSGVIYRANENHDHSYESGPEYQLIDDKGYPGKVEDNQRSGSDYAMHAASSLVTKPVGEYNHTVIKVKGAHVEHYLNGVKVVEFDYWTDDWKKLKDASKWKDKPEYGMLKAGHVCLQDHGGGVWFKNIKIRKI